MTTEPTVTIPLSVGAKVRILRDGDGPNGRTGIVRAVYKSGRCSVMLSDGSGFRNYAATDVEVIVETPA